MMAMTYLISAFTLLSFLFGLLRGGMDAVSGAALEGAAAAVQLCIGICGVTCLWSGLMAVMERSGLAAGLARLLRPVLARLFPRAFQNPEIAHSLSQNVSANLLGLGNAATPAGIKAMTAMAAGSETASHEVCRLAVMNSSSLQLIPTTVAAVRASLGCRTPMDILTCVWITSLGSVAAGLAAAALFARIGRRHG